MVGMIPRHIGVVHDLLQVWQLPSRRNSVQWMVGVASPASYFILPKMLTQNVCFPVHLDLSHLNLRFIKYARSAGANVAFGGVRGTEHGHLALSFLAFPEKRSWFLYKSDRLLCLRSEALDNS